MAIWLERLQMAEDDLFDPSCFNRMDPICDRFESAWKAGQTPRVEDYVNNSADREERSTLLKELLLIELDYRRHRGERPSQDEYIRRFPDEDEGAVQSAFQKTDAQAAYETSRQGLENTPSTTVDDHILFSGLLWQATMPAKPTRRSAPG